MSADYHIHTLFSCDAHDTIAAMGRQALAVGLDELAFTDHLDLVPADRGYGYYRPDAFHAELEACRAQFPMLTLRAGVEVGEMHRYAAQAHALLERYTYDVVIGSLHWVGDEIVFTSGYFARRKMDDAAMDYFQELLLMVRHGGFNILGHLDVFQRTGAAYYGCAFDLTRYEDTIRAVLRACVEGGIALEVNTSGLRYGLGQTQPPAEVLHWYRDEGGERLTLGSDAHRAEELACGFETAQRAALAAGFRRLCRFEHRQMADWIEIE